MTSTMTTTTQITTMEPITMVFDAIYKKHGFMRCSVKRSNGKIENNWFVVFKSDPIDYTAKTMDMDSGCVSVYQSTDGEHFSATTINKNVCIFDFLQINKFRMTTQYSQTVTIQLDGGQLLCDSELVWDNKS